MALRRDHRDPQPTEDRLLEVDASMQGTLSFKEPVKLRINGQFDGKLDTRGSLTIGDKAEVKATIRGDLVTVMGQFQGEIVASKAIELVPPASVSGTLRAPVIIMREGAVFNGQCDMSGAGAAAPGWLTVDDIARYLEVEHSAVMEWAASGRIPAVREGNGWKFERSKVDEWIASERIK